MNTNRITNIVVDNTTYEVGLPNLYINDKNNLNIETSDTIGNTPDISGKVKGKINIESKSDIQLKPGDDINIYSSHRGEGKQDEVAVKILDDNDKPVKLQINAAQMTLTTKDKTGDKPNVFDLNINAGSNDKGYLKVRAQNIDLRCEEHGGIALQPRGFDSDNHMNKIKFEHGGGDGLEFGTFNTEKTSLFTNEYRFNKDGVVKMATREQELSDKYDDVDETTHYKYTKQADDFYDVINNSDPVTTWDGIIKTAATLNGVNGNGSVETKVTSKGNIQISSKLKEDYSKEVFAVDAPTAADIAAGVEVGSHSIVDADQLDANFNKVYNASNGYFKVTSAETPHINIESDSEIKIEAKHPCVWDAANVTAENFGEITIAGGLKKGAEPSAEYVGQGIYAISDNADVKATTDAYNSAFEYVTCRQLNECSGINIETDGKLKIKGTEVSLKNVNDFGKSVNFGELENGASFQYTKLTKKGNTKSCDTLKVTAFNNSDDTKYLVGTTLTNGNGTVTGYQWSSTSTGADFTIPAKTETVIAQANLFDIITFVNWAKANHKGPWEVTETSGGGDEQPAVGS